MMMMMMMVVVVVVVVMPTDRGVCWDLHTQMPRLLLGREVTWGRGIQTRVLRCLTGTLQQEDGTVGVGGS